MSKKLIIAFAVMVFASAASAIPSGKVTINVRPAVQKNAKEVNLYLPYPMSDEYQAITKMDISGNYSTSGIYRDPSSEAIYFKAKWEKVNDTPQVTMSFHIAQKDRRKANLKDSNEDIPVIVKKYLESTKWLPADDPQMKEIAQKATKGKKGSLEKAKAVYDWMVENTFRDPDVKGCGLGIPGRTINQCKGGGKCADLSTLFVTLLRAAGVPARDVYGLRLSSPKEGDITSGFHCWAEFYLPGTGWVTADPADVRKMMLVHKLELKDADDWRTFFWGGDDLFRVVLEKNARGLLPIGAKEENRINYFMYPAAEVDGEMLNSFDAKSFVYSVIFEKESNN